MASDETAMPPFFGATQQSSNSATLLHHWRRLQARQSTVSLTGVGATGFVGDVTVSMPPGQLTITAPPATLVVEPPEVMIGVELVDVGERTDEGHIIAAVTPAWRRVLQELDSDSNALHRLDWRQTEELVAGAYREDGWSVTLTPRSNDKGRDIIAYRSDFGGIRVLDQVKSYKPGLVVDAEAVRAMWGVLDEDRKASKAVITTTSSFAPGVYTEFANRMPTRLELRDGSKLREWLKGIFRLNEGR